MNNIKKKTILRPVLLAVLALVLIAGASMGTAWAYFTTYATMKGGVTLSLGDTTEITERVDQNKKVVVISADEKSQPVFVRVKAFCSAEYSLTYEGTGWTLGTDDYYYYGEPIGANEDTTELTITILGADGNPIKVTDNAEPGDEFNIIVVYETVPVVFDQYENPDPEEAWKQKVSEMGGN